MSKYHHYQLLLTHSERQAIDFVGDRYRHGDDLYDVLINSIWNKVKENQVNENAIPGYSLIDEDIEWNGDYDIMFLISEHISWEIKDIIDAEIKDNKALTLFDDNLQCKLIEFCNRII